MHKTQLEILPVQLLNSYCGDISKPVRQSFEALTDCELSAGTFSFFTSVAVVFSSRVERESIEFDSLIKHKMLGVRFLPSYIHKIDDLYEAYRFAEQSPLNAETIKEAHTLLTKHILQKANRGKLRTGDRLAITAYGKIEYAACAPTRIKIELNKLYNDIELLLKTDLSFNETLFFAALIHLVFIKIQPFDDGNGLTARLIEKWFMAQKLGPKAWFVQSERYYHSQLDTYYANIRRLGSEYDALAYDEAMPFLKMTAEGLIYW